jgi:lambda family phage portal protein
MATVQQNFIDKAIGYLAPKWQLQRTRARMASNLMRRHYEGASVGRRTQGWRRTSTDAAQATGPFVGRLRDVTRDLVRNNPYAESAVSTIVDHTVGWGILAKPLGNAKATELWKAWAETTACDADGRHDIYGLQKLVLRTIVTSGEVLVRRRLRFPDDDLPIPMQLQILEPDFLDTSKDVQSLPNGGRIIQGVEFDPIGTRVAYWLFKEHPGSAYGTVESVRVPAENVRHVFRADRPGQVHGVPWFASTLLKFKDFDEFDDATLMKQKIAACLAVFVNDIDGTAAALGSTDASAEPQIDSLEPGMIMNLPPGRTVTVAEPPAVSEYAAYAATQLRAIATGLGVTYEDLTGNYDNMPFSAARMSRLRHWARVEDWRWRLMMPQFCNPVWQWFVPVATIFGARVTGVEWTTQPAPMIDPVNEGLAYMRNVRAGIQSLSESLRERGYDPKTVLEEIAADNKRLDELKLILDSDPRTMTQAGQLQGEALPEKEPAVNQAADKLEEAARELRLVGARR